MKEVQSLRTTLRANSSAAKNKKDIFTFKHGMGLSGNPKMLEEGSAVLPVDPRPLPGLARATRILSRPLSSDPEGWKIRWQIP
jgi:hypothetical protein